MKEKPLFFDMKQRTGPNGQTLVVSRDVAEMSDELERKVEAEQARERKERELIAKAESIEAEIERRISPLGTLGLPELLDGRRHKYGLTDAVFAQQAMFDRVMIMQIDRDDCDTYDPNGLIVMSDKGKTRKLESQPRGIIVSAGLLAMDQLETNGSGLGHIVTFARLVPWHIPFEMIKGMERYIIPIMTSDILADEDLWANLRAGKIKRARTPSNRHGFEGVGEPVETEAKEICE